MCLPQQGLSHLVKQRTSHLHSLREEEEEEEDHLTVLLALSGYTRERERESLSRSVLVSPVACEKFNFSIGLWSHPLRNQWATSD